MTGARSRARRALAALLLALCLLLSACAGPAAESSDAPEDGPLPTLEPRPEHREGEDVKVYVDGLLAGRAISRNGAVYVDPALLCSQLDLHMECAREGHDFSLRIGQLTITGETGQEYLCAGERYLYVPEGWVLEGDRVYLPAEAVGRIFQTEVEVTGEPGRVEISSRGARLMDGGFEFYLEHYTDEEIYWLAHIISAEAGTQPLAGQIGVGNVVLNRVADERYPNSIIEVIFQRGERTQFDPVEDGGINRESREISLVAALLCLEGYNTVGPSEFFVNPEIGNATWFEASRTFVIRIGDHDFYA